MHIRVLSLVVACALAVVPGLRAENSPASAQDREAAVRLQVFLDRANFGPGKIDGRYGDFTRKALALYRESRGEKPAMPPAGDKAETKGDAAPPDVNGLDLGSVDPVFVDYTVTEADLQNVGPVPEAVPEQAKLKSLPYKDAAEAVAEKFHCDVDFLKELNPEKTGSLKAGDQLKVPNVEPFDLAAVKPEKSKKDDPETSAGEDEKAEKKDDSQSAGAPVVTVKVDTKTNMASVYEGEKLVAAYPVTIGSGQTESPMGDWKVRGVAKMPEFRYDKAMLQHGERSGDYHMLPPGPNNPVGVTWIALNKKGIGLHGTNDPDSIGRSSSHGCVRLANWDIVRLAAKVKPGVPVAIH